MNRQYVTDPPGTRSAIERADRLWRGRMDSVSRFWKDQGVDARVAYVVAIERSNEQQDGRGRP